jgi:hypothetical protein
MWCWFCGHVEFKSCGIMEASTQISQKGLEGQEVCGRIDSLWAVPEKAMHKDVRVKLKLQWRPQEFRDARNMEHLWGKPQAVSGARPRKRLQGWRHGSSGRASALQAWSPKFKLQFHHKQKQNTMWAESPLEVTKDHFCPRGRTWCHRI